MPQSLLIYIYALIVSVGLCSCVKESFESDADSGDVVQVGQMLPAFSVTMSDGRQVSNLTLQGRRAAVVFFRTTCSDCQRELPKLQRFYEEMGDEVQFVCISRAESEADVQAFWQAQGLTLPYSAQEDSEVYALFATHTIPRIYIADKDGKVSHIFVEQADEEALRQALTQR